MEMNHGVKGKYLYVVNKIALPATQAQGGVNRIIVWFTKC